MASQYTTKHTIISLDELRTMQEGKVSERRETSARIRARHDELTMGEMANAPAYIRVLAERLEQFALKIPNKVYAEEVLQAANHLALGAHQLAKRG